MSAEGCIEFDLHSTKGLTVRVPPCILSIGCGAVGVRVPRVAGLRVVVPLAVLFPLKLHPMQAPTRSSNTGTAVFAVRRATWRDTHAFLLFSSLNYLRDMPYLLRASVVSIHSVRGPLQYSRCIAVDIGTPW
eukprot:TRINITY_DN8323_c0_g1_i1.p2 TRINITY_DN8323_c0_g1~~TRINITY_DN8323_c0_g1_i1.p2  ORF type:complete len:132 (+),score=0.20 TRINITY_DN8323_c0_g1_i1:909-1304(+)